MPKVSVIVPNYNHGRFLEKRLRSVLDQTYRDLELIFLDDASTDDSREVFDRFSSDPRIRSEFNVINSASPFGQWNKGVRLARGEYVWIAESDDYADTTFLEKLTHLLDAHPNVGLAYCNSWVMDADDRLLFSAAAWAAPLDSQRWCSNYVNSGADECGRYLVIQNTIPNASAVLFRRDAYIRAGMADDTMRYCGDWLMWVRVLLHSDVAFVSEPLNYFRYHDGTVRAAMGNTQVALVEHARILLEIGEQVTIPPPHGLLVGRAVARLQDEIACLNDKLRRHDEGTRDE